MKNNVILSVILLEFPFYKLTSYSQLLHWLTDPGMVRALLGLVGAVVIIIKDIIKVQKIYHSYRYTYIGNIHVWDPSPTFHNSKKLPHESVF